MSKSKSRSVSGGGASSRVVRNVAIKSGARTTNVSTPNAAASIGRQVGNHSEKGTTQRPNEPLRKPASVAVAMGNAVALNVGKGGPGTGRVVHPSGGQGKHGGAK